VAISVKCEFRASAISSKAFCYFGLQMQISGDNMLS
jgi:hypothetical protein